MINTMNDEDLIVPDDDRGWTDETFNRAIRFVMRQTTLVDVTDMQAWASRHINPGPNWFWQKSAINGGFHYGPPVFKRTILLSFRSLPPSMLKQAFDDINEHPRRHSTWRNIYYHLFNIAIGLFVAFLVIAMLINWL